MKKTLFLCLSLFTIMSCGEQTTAVEDRQTEQLELPTENAPLSPVAPDAAVKKHGGLAQLGFERHVRPMVGDLDMMDQNRVIRVLTVYGLGRYFLDGAQEKGMTFDFFKKFEKVLNEDLGKGHVKLHVVFIPVSRDELIPALIEGRGDIVAAGLTITPERDELIDFTDPVSKNISEVLVTGATAPSVESIDDLAGRTIYVRASSSYRASIDKLNLVFKKEGKPVIKTEDANEALEDEDILEMVESGLLDWAVVDDYKALIWEKVFKNIVVRKDIVFRDGGRIAFAIRQHSPKLKAVLNDFLKTNRQGTLSGNMLINRYYRDFDWQKHALFLDDFHRFSELENIFHVYGKQYGIDYLIVAAQGYQESRLDQSAKSAAGAIGVMQLLPSTAKDSNVGIEDISTADANIHAGIKYLNFIRQRYFSSPEIDPFNKTMFALAAYNAGPARIRRLRDKAEKAGYDPNQWFDNVEIFAGKEIGRETVQYVANILKYFIAYSLITQQELKRKQARKITGLE